MRFLLTLSRRSLAGFSADDCPLMAAAIAYYVLLSIFPLLIFIVGVLGVFLQDQDLRQDVIDAVLDFIPLSEVEGQNDVREAVDAVQGTGGATLGIVGLAAMVWAASGMFAVIRRSINRAYGIERKRPFVQQKLLDLGMVGGTGLFFLVSVSATALLRISRQVGEDLPLSGEAADRSGYLWDAASFLIPLALSFVAFAVLYRIVPVRKVTLGEVWPGALVAAVLFEVAKIGFSVYLENFASYGVVYGSLGAVVAFLIWTYLSASILLLGAEVAAEYPGVRSGQNVRPAVPSRPLGATLKAAVRGLFVSDKPPDSEDETARPTGSERRR